MTATDRTTTRLPVPQRDLGGVTLDVVHDGVATMTAREAFGDRAEDVVRSHPEQFTADTFTFPIVAFLVRGGGRTTLVDAGAGPRNSWVRSGVLLDNLDRLGVRPPDVDDIVYTHLHWDHIGWASQKGVPTFEHATHHCHRLDWAHFFGRQPGATKRLRPVADDVRLFDTDGPLIPHIETLHAPGHTPGSTVILVAGTDDRVALLGDVVHCPFQLHETGSGFVSDDDADEARRSRDRIFALLRDRGIEATAAHFPDLRPTLIDDRRPPCT